tara:strand:+ start:640 stop:1500 length:861 start_codon:yes stop_codon:yes gene_type:complete
VEINPPFVPEPRVKNLAEIVLIPPAEIIPPTTLGELPFGFVPIIELPCVVARDKKTGIGDEMFNVDPRNNLTLCDHAPVIVVAASSGSIVEDISDTIPKPESPIELLNQLQETLNNEREEVKKKDGKKDKKEDNNVNQNLNLNLNTGFNDKGFVSENLPCPPLDTLAKKPIGSLGKGGLARIKGWLRDETDGTCKTLWEGLSPLEIAGNYAPQPTVLVNTSAIAVGSVIAVTAIGQPLAKFVQKQLKGQIKSFSKKITKKLLAIRGKKEKILSLSERRKAQKDLRK